MSATISQMGSFLSTRLHDCRVNVKILLSLSTSSGLIAVPEPPIDRQRPTRDATLPCPTLAHASPQCSVDHLRQLLDLKWFLQRRMLAILLRKPWRPVTARK